MGIYSYGITGTRHIDGIGEVSTVRFRFSRSYADRERVERQRNADYRYLVRWDNREFPRLVVRHGGLGVWTSKYAIGNECVQNLRGNVLHYLPDAELNALPAWVLLAVEAVDRGDIPFVPTSHKEYLLLSDAYLTLRLRQRGDRNAEPLVRNNPWWVKLLKSDHPLHQTSVTQ